MKSQKAISPLQDTVHKETTEPRLRTFDQTEHKQHKNIRIFFI